MPQSSRVIVTWLASAFQRASSGGEAAVTRNSSGRSAAAEVLCIRQCLIGLAPPCKHLRRCALDQLIGVADAEMMAAVITIELFPGDRSGDRSAFAGTRRIRHDRGRSALVPEPVEKDAVL